MKKVFAFALAAAVSAGAYANTASYLPPGPIYIKLNGNEQVAVNGATTWAGTNEINWGVFTVSTMETGSVSIPHDSVSGTGDIFFVNGQAGQITGMFYGVQAGNSRTNDPNGNNNPYAGTGGYVDLYWRDLSSMSKTSNASTTAGVRCGFDCATGYTEGTFLGRLQFASGMDTVDPNNYIVGTTVPSSNGFSGIADSYASVDTTMPGLWTNQLDSNWFSTWQGMRDLRFKNSYNYLPSWNGGAGVLGARIDDPGQAVALPEPGALSLMGLALAGMGLALRRRQKR